MLTESWQIFVDHYPQFMAVYRKIAKMDWFKEGNWVVFIGHYTNGIFMQVYKPHWYNHELEGIHFEVALDSVGIESNIVNIQLHITHRNVLPDRDKFNSLTVPKMAAVVSKWGPRYEFSTKALSERLNLNVPFTKSNFAQKVTDEIIQVCKLGDIIPFSVASLAVLRYLGNATTTRKAFPVSPHEQDSASYS